jgi:hypothetical protein
MHPLAEACPHDADMNRKTGRRAIDGVSAEPSYGSLSVSKKSINLFKVVM